MTLVSSKVRGWLAAIGLFAAAALPNSVAISVGLNPASPLQGFTLGGGQYATLVGVQTPGSLVGQTITVADLNAAILSGSVLGWYYGPGNAVSASFDDIALFSPFVSDDVVPGSDASRYNRIWDSLYAVHTGTVVFSNGNGGTTTMGTGGSRVQRNPFGVPDSGTTLSLLGLGLGLVGLVSRRVRS